MILPLFVRTFIHGGVDSKRAGSAASVHFRSTCKRRSLIHVYGASSPNDSLRVASASLVRGDPASIKWDVNRCEGGGTS